MVAIDHHKSFKSSAQSRNVDLRDLESYIISFLGTEEGQRVIQRIKSLDFDVFREEAQTYLKDDVEDYLKKTFQNNKGNEMENNSVGRVDYVEQLIERLKFFKMTVIFEEINNSKKSEEAN